MEAGFPPEPTQGTTSPITPLRQEDDFVCRPHLQRPSLASPRGARGLKRLTEFKSWPVSARRRTYHCTTLRMVYGLQLGERVFREIVHGRSVIEIKWYYAVWVLRC